MTQSVRQYPRYALEAAIELVSPAGSIHGRTKDVSAGGLAALVDRPLPSGSRVDVRLSLVFDEDTFSEPLALAARVAWCTPLGEGFQVGASFLPMDTDQHSYLAMFVRYLREGIERLTRERDARADRDGERDPFA